MGLSFVSRSLRTGLNKLEGNIWQRLRLGPERRVGYTNYLGSGIVDETVLSSPTGRRSRPSTGAAGYTKVVVGVWEAFDNVQHIRLPGSGATERRSQAT